MTSDVELRLMFALGLIAGVLGTLGILWIIEGTRRAKDE